MKDTKAWAAVECERPNLDSVAHTEQGTFVRMAHDCYVSREATVEPVYIISEARYRELTKCETEDRG